MHAPRDEASAGQGSPGNPLDRPESSGERRIARHGVWLFLVYVLFYGGFIAAAAFRPDLMGRRAPGGVNVAIAYGFALIGVALALALVYMFLCRTRAGRVGRP